MVQPTEENFRALTHSLNRGKLIPDSNSSFSLTYAKANRLPLQSISVATNRTDSPFLAFHNDRFNAQKVPQMPLQYQK
jgi:hypothetical protein